MQAAGLEPAQLSLCETSELIREEVLESHALTTRPNLLSNEQELWQQPYTTTTAKMHKK